MTFKSKESRLFLFLATFFVVNAVMAEFIGVKIFSVEKTLGVQPFSINLFGVESLSFNMSAGVLTWPLVFIFTDIINEYFGIKQVRFLSWLTVGFILFCFLVVFMAIRLHPADFWEKQTVDGKVVWNNAAFKAVFGQGLWIIIGSIVAFLAGQILDVVIFHKIKKMTGEKALWLRATGSTLVSQFIDSFVVILIAFYLNPAYNWSLKMVLAIGLVNYTYKFIIAICMTPILYLVHQLIDRYLGKDLSDKLLKEATVDE